MMSTSQIRYRLCRRLITAMALPAVIAMFGSASAFSGALFTTDEVCHKVNGNIYAAKTEVFLNGGPGGTGSQLAPSTTYCIRVSAPGCNVDLNTKICTVDTDESGNFPCLNLFVCTGFANTCNPGGEYKVEACPLEGDACVFRPGNQCKSDNFKVDTTPTCSGGATVCIFCPDDIDVPCTDRAFGQKATVTYRPPFVIGGIATCDPPSGSEFSVGEHTVTCTVDGSVPSVSCSFKVTVEGCPQECALPLLDPVSACVCSASVDAVVTFTPTPSLTDPNTHVSFDFVSCDHTSGSAFPVGTTAVVCTYKDAAGDECTTGFSVTVTADVGPTIHCPADKELHCGDSTEPSNTGSPTYEGALCGGTVTITHVDTAAAVNCTGKAGIDRTWTATDECLKTDSCVQHITFADTTPPAFTACPSATLTGSTCAPGTCAPVSFTVTATDNCGGSPTIVCTNSSGNIVHSGDCFPVGTTAVTCIATDGCGNHSAPCNFSINVKSTICGGLTIGFWQNKNGQGIITSYCLGAGAGTIASPKISLVTFLRCYLPFQDLSATANCSAVATYVSNIIKAANASGASMNAMLKAQMLATALDAYFSDPALGGNKISAPTPIGGLAVNLTQVCKMIDSTSGTATCSGVYLPSTGAFGGATCLTVKQVLSYAASQSNVGGTTWYAQVKATQELAKNAFDAINNGVALSGCTP